MHESEQLIREAIAAGARAYILKSDAGQHLIQAVEPYLDTSRSSLPKQQETSLESSPQIVAGRGCHFSINESGSVKLFNYWLRGK
jgi:DNA-binding NarL/FixJ family response regulator